jgi:hypothetical protein
MVVCSCAPSCIKSEPKVKTGGFARGEEKYAAYLIESHILLQSKASRTLRDGNRSLKTHGASLTRTLRVGSVRTKLARSFGINQTLYSNQEFWAECRG